MTKNDEKALDFHLSNQHHMKIPWGAFVKDEQVPAREASLQDRASIVGRIGILMLSCGCDG